MPRYDHLPLKRIEGELERRKTGSIRTPPREPKTHGPTLQAAIASAVEAQQQKPKIAGIDPTFVLKLRAGSAVSEEGLARVGLQILASDADKTLVVRAADNELQALRERIVAYQQPPPEGQKNPQYASFIEAIDEIGSTIPPAEKIGSTLVTAGIRDVTHFVVGERYTLDVELWQADNDMSERFIFRVSAKLTEIGGALINEYRGNAVTLVRVECDGAQVSALLDLPEIARIDLPPNPDFPPLEPEDFTVEDVGTIEGANPQSQVIGVIDSGLNSAHPLLVGSVVATFGQPAELGDDDEKGHGTPVSGIAAFGDLRQRLAAGKMDARFRIAVAKVVNQHGRFDDRQVVPAQMEAAIRRLHGEYSCKVINISLADNRRPVAAKPSAWAAVLDQLARELDLVIVISAGNTEPAALGALGETIVEEYPQLLFAASNRILEPASAVNVLTVGSIAHSNGIGELDAGLVGVRQLTEAGQPSPFTRIGPGVRRIVKPDLVDFGGTVVFDGPTQSIADGTKRSAAGILTTHHLYLERLFTCRSGTSFASPLVAYKAALVRDAFPACTANLVRSLLALSARMPDTALRCLTNFDDDDIAHVLGNGVCDIDRALSSDDNRVVLYREDALPPDRFAVFEIPVPEIFQTTKGVRHIAVSLAFDPPVRHTRIDYAGISMGFRLLRGANEADVLKAFQKWEKSKGKAFKLPHRFNCKATPGPRRRERGTLQRAEFSAKSDLSDYGDKYYLVVTCEGGWATSLVQKQRFAVAVEISHEAQIPLYERIEERVRVRV